MTEPERPNPDDLLVRVSEEDRARARGKLKVFFGAAPGVGKTFAMLEAARLQRKSGVDVVVGVVETHNRAETEALLEGLEVLPRRSILHRGVKLEEFDLDRALARKPELLLVDELAHANALGSRHVKRWQDVMELIDAGISVYTTLNVQHLDSLNDLVAQVTGVAVRETIPDSVLDRAGDIELVDLPVEELRRRMEEGKVYIPDQAQRAMENFFRPGNLIALREMALRRTADRVDAQMRNYRRDHAIQPTWPVTERLIVSIGPSPFSAKLIRAARRMAERLQAEWIVAFVETPDFADAPHDARERVRSSLRLAEQLGAETVTLAGSNVADSLLRYARSRNVSKIVIGKQTGPLWKRLLRGSVLDDLVPASGDIDIYAISGEPGAPLRVTPAPVPAGPAAWRGYVFALAVVAACTLLALALRETLNPVNLLMFYLLGVVAVAMRSTRRVALLTSFLSVAAFDFFCVPPYYTFAVADYEYVVTFAVMFAVGVLISTLTVRIRTQAVHAVDREARTQALFRLTRELTAERRDFDAARIAARITREVFASQVVVFLPEGLGKISFRRRTSDDLPVPRAEEGVAQWVFDHGQKAGKGTDTLPGATALYLPLKGSRRTVGVMAIVPENDLALASPEQLHLLEIFATQIALAMERSQSAAEAREAQVRIETEQMRNSLLSAVSHDLRTPLASITGAATSLLAHRDQLDAATQNDLLESIAQEAQRLSRLVNNLLEMTRLESGAVELKRDWHPLEEILGAALTRLDRLLGNRPVETRLPPDLPLVSVDDVLLEQVFINILENAARYTPDGSPITVSAALDDSRVAIEFLDRGPGFAPGEEDRVWEKFYRGKVDGARGAGLGLAICHAIVRAHAGSIQARNRDGGGAVIRILLPTGGPPPQVTLDE
ncbi:MAG: sensor histidine kinase KdpD [Bryobacteraceae bacterium]|nr:sensor histidine kinase KdpD [Bryobacteraceae bacterium]